MRTAQLVFGVLCGMPQYVWSQHHQFHHAHNGNWDRYRGPLNIVPVSEYAAMSVTQRRRYRHARSIWMAPLAGFLYVVLNPRRSRADILTVTIGATVRPTRGGPK